MIKEFSTITTQDLEKLYEDGFVVSEKLDMYYFRIEITKVGAIATKGSTENAISDIDCITNTMYKNICKFVDEIVNPIRHKIIDNYGELRIGMFYLPTPDYHIIPYHALQNNTFILSDLYYYEHATYKKDLEVNDLMNLLISGPNYETVNWFNLYPTPQIMSWTKNMISDKIDKLSVEDAIASYLLGTTNTIELAKVLTTNETFTRTTLEKIEGLIIRSNSRKQVYKLTINDTDTPTEDKSTKLMYRETVLRSFINTMQKYARDNNISDLLAGANTYIDKVSKLFTIYIENTDLFSKYSIDPEDLLPPHVGYIGDVDLESIPDKNVYLFCRYSEVNKNIFRLFLHTFSRSLTENKFSSFTPEEQEYLQNIIVRLNYRNYRQIMLTAYKSTK